ncbi:hypothetical protein ABZU45_27960 [Streptomyces avermitilis]|uniref:hypothetical protein n=1 Tax=Streptomyces avermitilis TaxID=33903 RepID=UPI0033AF0B7E
MRSRDVDADADRRALLTRLDESGDGGRPPVPRAGVAAVLEPLRRLTHANRSTLET